MYNGSDSNTSAHTRFAKPNDTTICLHRHCVSSSPPRILGTLALRLRHPEGRKLLACEHATTIGIEVEPHLRTPVSLHVRIQHGTQRHNVHPVRQERNPIRIQRWIVNHCRSLELERWSCDYQKESKQLWGLSKVDTGHVTCREAPAYYQYGV